ncbi:MAG: hypothetical protein ACRD1Z_09655, partial [Vicinamibacteria bacterium]
KVDFQADKAIPLVPSTDQFYAVTVSKTEGTPDEFRVTYFVEIGPFAGTEIVDLFKMPDNTGELVAMLTAAGLQGKFRVKSRVIVDTKGPAEKGTIEFEGGDLLGRRLVIVGRYDHASGEFKVRSYRKVSRI